MVTPALPGPPAAGKKGIAATAERSRLVPLVVAGLVCFVAAFLLAYIASLLFGSRRSDIAFIKPDVTQTATPNAQPTPVAEALPPAPPVKLAPAGELAVEGGEVTTGGADTKQPVRRQIVAAFLIAETEVTNEQYREFVKASNRQPPKSWKSGEFAPGTGGEPVTGVTWQDAVAYCKWLSEQIGAEVRLPTEAEWERAARGTQEYKYPWGNDWNERAAASTETRGVVRPVKSYPIGVSPAGAFDMVGNVWEWIADEARDEEGKPKSIKGVVLRIAKGGAADEPAKVLTAQSRAEIEETFSSQSLGFRYVVIRNANAAGGASSENGKTTAPAASPTQQQTQ